MSSVAQTFFDALTFRGGFNTSVVVAGTTLLGAAAGVTGMFALLRKRSLIADALSHATLPGAAAAFLIAAALGSTGRSLPVLLAGAAVSGVLGVLAIHLLARHTRLREDAAIGAVLGVFFGAGVVLLSVVQTSGAPGAAGLNTLIFGSTATMNVGESALMLALAGAAAVASVLLAKEFTLVAFNEGFARSLGWPVGLLDLILMALIVLVTLAGLPVVGLIMVVALLIIPAAAARFWTDRVRVAAPLAGALGALSCFVGSALSAAATDTPAGPVIVLLAGAVFTLSLLVAPRRGVIPVFVRAARLKLRFACEHALEDLTEHNDGAGPVPASVLDQLAVHRGWSRWVRPIAVFALVRAGAVRHAPNGALELTERGRRRGERIARNHALWSRYLITHADIAPSHVDWAVDQVEHVLDPALIERLETDIAAAPGREGAPA